MSIWWTIPAFVGLIGLLTIVTAIGRLLTLRFVTGSFRFLFGGVLLAGAAVVGLVGLNLQTYARLTHERPGARVTLHQTGPSAFNASVEKADDKGSYGVPKDYALTGDSFRMEARILKWKPWANITGFDSLYRIERLQGRFDNVESERKTPPKPYEIGDKAGIDLFEMSRGQARAINVVDAYYGSGTFVPMADGAQYAITVTQDGLIARPENKAAEDAVRNWSVVPPASADQQQTTAPATPAKN